MKKICIMCTIIFPRIQEMLYMANVHARQGLAAVANIVLHFFISCVTVFSKTLKVFQIIKSAKIHFSNGMYQVSQKMQGQFFLFLLINYYSWSTQRRKWFQKITLLNWRQMLLCHTISWKSKKRGKLKNCLTMLKLMG